MKTNVCDFDTGLEFRYGGRTPPTQPSTLTRTNLDSLCSEDRELQNSAFTYILKATDKPVDWAYEEWNALVKDLRHRTQSCEGDCGPGSL